MARKATRVEPSALTHPEDRRDAARRARAEVRFDEQAMLGALFGEFDANLVQIENRLGVLIAARGNKVVIEGSEDDVARARDVLVTMHERLLTGQQLDSGTIEALMASARARTDHSRTALDSQSQYRITGASDRPQTALWDATIATTVRPIRQIFTHRRPDSCSTVSCMELSADQEYATGLTVQGTGQPMVLVPGMDGTGQLFYRQVPSLARSFRVATYALRNDAQTMETLVNDLGRVVDAAAGGDGKAIVVGESLKAGAIVEVQTWD